MAFRDKLFDNKPKLIEEFISVKVSCMFHFFQFFGQCYRNIKVFTQWQRYQLSKADCA